jgi:hypothetical protein
MRKMQQELNVKQYVHKEKKMDGNNDRELNVKEYLHKEKKMDGNNYIWREELYCK